MKRSQRLGLYETMKTAARLCVCLLVGGLSFAAGLLVVGSQDASAACTNYSGAYTVYRYDPNQGYALVGLETYQNSGTCDSDNFYAGSVDDPYTDGYCVEAWYQDYNYFASQQYECNGSWANYGYWDTNSDSTSYLDPKPGYISFTQYALNNGY